MNGEKLSQNRERKGWNKNNIKMWNNGKNKS